jgi:diguanylate cyclase (GGDEF)-like protein/PAS domain S-box-containing protein
MIMKLKTVGLTAGIFVNDLLKKRSATLRIVGIYALVGCLWIYTSDTVLGWLVQEPHIMVKIAIYKGSFYIILTSLLLYFLINRYSKNLAASEQALHDQVRSLLESEAERKQAEKCALEKEYNYRILFESANDGIFLQDTTGFLDCNQRGADMYELTREQIIGHPPANFSPEYQPDGRLSSEVEAEKTTATLSGIPQTFEWQPIRANGTLFDVEITLNKVELADKTCLLAIVRDITERKQYQKILAEDRRKLETQLAEITALQHRLQEQAVRDPLTGLNNRRYLDETLPRELSRAKREGYPLALIMLDVDHFKKINDTYGHQAGDEVLEYLSSILINNARESDIVCRYGGEEFLVVLPRMSLDNAFQRVEEWRLIFSEKPVKNGELLINVTFSGGISVFPEHAADADTLIALADDALYISKNKGRNCISCTARHER